MTCLSVVQSDMVCLFVVLSLRYPGREVSTSIHLSLSLSHYGCLSILCLALPKNALLEDKVHCQKKGNVSFSLLR